MLQQKRKVINLRDLLGLLRRVSFVLEEQYVNNEAMAIESIQLQKNVEDFIGQLENFIERRSEDE